MCHMVLPDVPYKISYILSKYNIPLAFSVWNCMEISKNECFCLVQEILYCKHALTPEFVLTVYFDYRI